MRAYVDAAHTPRWLMGLCALAALLSLALAIPRRTREHMAGRRETFLLAGSALSILFMSVATSEFIVRYLLPEVPILVAGGALAARDLALWASAGRARGRATRVASAEAA